MDRIYPVIFCHMELNGTLDPGLLTQAVTQSSHFVPEILCLYDSSKKCFADPGFTASSVILTDQKCFEKGWRWDLCNDTQLKILITHNASGGCSVTAAISHILCDGKGFIQYLELLAKLYNQLYNQAEGLISPTPQLPGKQFFMLKPSPLSSAVNRRKFLSFRSACTAGPATEQEQNYRKRHTQSLPLTGRGEACHCFTAPITSGQMKKIKEKANAQDATLNDVFLTAYARTASRLLHADRVLIPCPADLRPCLNPQTPDSDIMTIANLTGLYNVVVEVLPGHGFSDTLNQVHLEMCLQKVRHRCFGGLFTLHFLTDRFPFPKKPIYSILKGLYKKYGPFYPVSYTNPGIINPDGLQFQGCFLQDCYITGSFRSAPDFQLTISTFRGTCTLSTSMTGSITRLKHGEAVLNLVRKELLNWSEMP